MNKVEEVTLEIASSGLTKLVEFILHKWFGNEADDSVKEKVARAALNGASIMAQSLAATRLASEHLEERLKEATKAIASIDVAKLFTPKEDMTRLIYDVEIKECQCYVKDDHALWNPWASKCGPVHGKYCPLYKETADS